MTRFAMLTLSASHAGTVQHLFRCSATGDSMASLGQATWSSALITNLGQNSQ